jgi:hypothetical protein
VDGRAPEESLLTVAGSKLKVAEQSPTEQIVQEANEVVLVTDSKGRKIGVKRPNVLAQYRLIETVGADTASNQVYMSMAMPVYWVVSVDGDKIPQPRTKAQLESAITRLDDEGIQAVIDHMIAVGAPLGDEEAEAELKNV